MQPLIFFHPMCKVFALGEILDLLRPLNIIFLQEIFALLIQKVSEFMQPLFSQRPQIFKSVIKRRIGHDLYFSVLDLVKYVIIYVVH